MAETEFVLKLNRKQFTASGKQAERDFSGSMKGMQRSVGGVGSAFEVESDKIDIAAKKTTLHLGALSRNIVGFGLTTAAALGVKATVGAFADFESGLIGVGKTANIEGKELAQFGDDIQALSRDIPVSTAELLELSQAAGQLGVKGTQNLLQFSRVMAELASASDVNGESGALEITRILGITGEGIGQVDQFSNVLVGLGNSVRASESEILSLATRVAQGTAAFNLSSTEILGISAGLKGLGVEAEVAGSTLQKTFITIKDAIDEGGESLETLSNITGQTSAQLGQLFKEDQAGLLDVFIKGLSDVKEAGGDVIGTLKSLGIEEVRSISVLSTAAKGYDDYSAALRTAQQEAIKNSARTEEAAKAFASLDSQIGKSAGSLSRAGEEMGELFAPFASATLSLASKLLDGIAEDIEKINKELRDSDSTTSQVVTELSGAARLFTSGTFGFFDDDVIGIAEALLYPISTFNELTSAAKLTQEQLAKLKTFDTGPGLQQQTKQIIGLQQAYLNLGKDATKTGKDVKESFEAQSKAVSKSIKAQLKDIDKQINKLQEAAGKAKQFRDDLDEAIKQNSAGPGPSEAFQASDSIVKVRRASTEDDPEKTIELGREALEIITQLRDDGVIDEKLAGAQLKQLKQITAKAAEEVQAKSESAIEAFQQEAEELGNIKVGIDKASAEAAAKGLTLTMEKALASLKIPGVSASNVNLNGNPNNPANFDPRDNVLRPYAIQDLNKAKLAAFNAPYQPKLSKGSAAPVASLGKLEFGPLTKSAVTGDAETLKNVKAAVEAIFEDAARAN